MTIRSYALPAVFLLVAPLATATLRAQGVEYSAGTMQYRISTVNSGSQTSPMGNQDFRMDVKQLLTVNLARPAKDTVVATVTLDSMDISGIPTKPDLSRIFGAKFITYLSPTGKLYSTKAPEGADPVLTQVTEGVARFLPSYRANLHSGMTWADTVTDKVNQQGMELNRTVVSSYRVLGDTTISGTKAFKLSRVAKAKAAGSGTTQGQPISVESATTSDAIFLLSPNGVYLGGQQNDDIDVKITILSQGAEINVKQTAKSTIEALK